MIPMFRAQNSRNDTHSVVVWPSNPPPSNRCHRGNTLEKKVWSASPPIHAWIPNQPQATRARINAGRFEPIVPYAARAKTGNGMPYFVPGCELRRIGTSTIVLPRATVNSACPQLIPAAMRPADNM
jgi:hypothetical protein